MRRALKYFALQLKRTAKAYIGILALALVLLVLVGTVGGIMLAERQESDAYIKMRVGLVGNREDKLLNMWITLIREVDSSGVAIDFIDCDSEETAISQLQNRDIDSFVVIPDGFAEAAMSGKNMQLSYVMAKSGASMSSLITREVIEVISNYVIETQTGVGAMYDYARDLGYEYDDRMAFNLELSTKYIATVLGRGNFADVREIGIGNNLSAVGYYACGLAVFFIMALGIAFCSVRVKGERTMDRLLYSRGYGAAAQVAAEYLPYLAAVCLILFISLTAVGIMSEFTPIPIAELENWLFRDFVALGFKIIPAVFAVTAMQFLLYEFTSGMINSVLLQFTVAIIMGYIGGCFYPLNFMPESVQKIACVLPVGVASDYIGNLMTGEGGKPFACVLYGVTLVALAFAVRRARIRLTEGA